MRCSKCKNQIDDNSIFCRFCGTETPLLSNQLNFKTCLKQAKQAISSDKNKFYSLSIFLSFMLLVPAAVIIYFFSYNLIAMYLLAFLGLPFLLVPLATGSNIFKGLSIASYFKLLKFYPKFLSFSAINVIYYFLLKLICTGKPFYFYEYDPILNLVQLVMMFYWLAVVLPAPLIMVNENKSALKAIIKAYTCCKQTRWQQFYLVVSYIIMAILGTLTLGLGNIIMLPLFYSSMVTYYSNMLKYNTFNASAYTWAAVKNNVDKSFTSKLLKTYILGGSLVFVGSLFLFIPMQFLPSVQVKTIFLTLVIAIGMFIWRKANNLKDKKIIEIEKKQNK